MSKQRLDSRVPTEQGWDIIGGLVEHKVELGISLVHFVSLQKAEAGSPQQMVLVVHDDLVGHGVQQRGLRDELLLGIFVLLFACLLDIVGRQRVQTGHLVLLVVSVVQVSVDTCRLQQLDEVLGLALFVVLQLKIYMYISEKKKNACMYKKLSDTYTHRKHRHVQYS